MSRIRRFPFLLTAGVLLLGAFFGLNAVQIPGSGGDVARAAPVAQLSPADHVVVSEFRTRGPNTAVPPAAEEFVELFNPTNTTINITGWQIRKSSGCGTIAETFVTIDSFVLQPGQHYLAAALGSSITNPDQTFTPGIEDDGGIAVLDTANNVIDQVGMCVTTLYLEGTALTPMGGVADQGYERKPGGISGSCYDTNDNLADFGTLISPIDPQNTTSPFTPCGAVVPTATDTTIPPSPTDTTFPPTPTNTAPTPTLTDTVSPPTATATASPSVTATATDTTLPSATATATLTPTSTSTPKAPLHLVISEFRSLGPAGAGDEFIEIFNPTGASINIGGWTIKKSSGCSYTVSTVATFPTNTIMLSGQHYLLAATGSSFAAIADRTFSAGIVDDGGLGLINASGIIVDEVGMCMTTYYREGVPLKELVGSADQSYERKPGGTVGGCYDINNNDSDFARIVPANPQNRSSQLTMCTGVLTATATSTATATRTATPTRTRTPTRTPSRYPTPQPSIVINEFLPHPRMDWNADGVTDFGDEYIEIMNLGTTTANLKNWKLDDDESGSSPYILPDLTLQPRQIIAFFASQTGISLSDGGDSVRLIKLNGQIADIYNYPVVEAADRTWCRLPDGTETLAFICWPTPGRPNSRTGTSSVPTGPDDMAASCPLADGVPDSIRAAECGSPGDAIWNFEIWSAREIWLNSPDKWDLFIE